MGRIDYHVPVPRLTGMTEEQRNRAIENYMRESQRQLRIILTALDKETDKRGNDNAERTETDA